MVHALELALECVKEWEEREQPAKYIELRAGDLTLCGRLYSWFAEGTWNLQSAAGAEIAQRCYELAATLPVPLILYSYEPRIPELEQVPENLEIGWTVERVTTGRARVLVGHEGMAELVARLPRIPLTHEEVKERLKIRYEQDELHAIHLMAKGGSAAGQIYRRLGLTRNIIALALEGLADSRALQVVLCSIICATRFKMLVEGKLHETACRRCGGTDGLEHLLECAGLTVPERTTEPEPTIAFLIAMAKAAYAINPGVPEPSPEQAEVSLDVSSEGGEEESPAELSLQELLSTDEDTEEEDG